jgi:lysophospholipase L1-like esterase
MSFMKEGRWTNALALKGDYYLIQFGHNNQPGKPGRSTDMPTFISDMTRYVDDARAAGAKPVLVTPLTRRQWDKSGGGKIKSSLTAYADEVKKIAADKKVPLVDLHTRSIELCEKLGREGCYAFSPLKGTNGIDGTHLNAEGSLLFARLVVEELVRAVPELKPCFRDETRPSTAQSDPQASALNSQRSAGVFNVRALGAVGDGKTLDTQAIQSALDACAKTGGGVVRLIAGTYLSKPIFLKSSGTTLELEAGATLQATDEPADFVASANPGPVCAFVNAVGLTNIAIVGKGTIDGAGARWWPPVREAKKRGEPELRPRPRMVVLSHCQGVRVQGVTLANSPSFHLVPTECEDVLIEGVTIKAPADSPNTDAIDPSACRNVRITKCVLDVGDDNVAIKSGHPVRGRTAACEDITVTDCTFLHGHGMSIGSETTGGVRRLTVQHCTFQDTVSGLRIKSARDRGGLVEDISYSDITMKDVKIPINICSYYPKTPKEDDAQSLTSHTPIFRRIRISNLTATSPGSAGLIIGLPEQPVSELVLENVRLSAPVGLTIRNAKSVELRQVGIEVQKGEPLILKSAEVRKY